MGLTCESVLLPGGCKANTVSSEAGRIMNHNISDKPATLAGAWFDARSFIVRRHPV